MFATVFNDLIVLFCFLIVGFILRELIKPLQKLFIPASVLGGLVALIVGPQVLGLIELPETLSGMPGPMIVLVMTAMFMGMKVSKASLKNYAGATDISCMLYFAQAAVGLLVGCGLSAVWDTLPEHWGVIGVFSFFGGHGTAASAGAIFGEYGIDGSLDLGIIFSTLGLVLAMVVGVVILNIGARKGYVSTVTKNADPSMYGGLIPETNGHRLVWSVCPAVASIPLRCSWVSFWRAFGWATSSLHFWAVSFLSSISSPPSCTAWWAPSLSGYCCRRYIWTAMWIKRPWELFLMWRWISALLLRWPL